MMVWFTSESEPFAPELEVDGDPLANGRNLAGSSPPTCRLRHRP